MQIVKLNLIPGGVLPVCFASQNDTGRVIRFLLFEGENVFTLSGAESIALRLQKPDGSELVESVTNTGADYVDVVTTADTCDTAGASVGEIAITDGGDVIGSANFGLFVESDAFDGGDIVTQTASGAIATFSTNIETAFASLKSDINPVQDLHGYSKPWNGGAGKNKLENTSTVATLYGVTFSKNNDGSVKLTGTSTGSGTGTYISFFTLPSGTYIFTDGSTSTNYYMFLMVEGDGTWYKNGMSFTVDGNTRTRVVMYIASGTATNTTLYPMIRLASVSDATFEPYENICPISGFSALNVTLADGDMQTVDTKTVNFGQTVYGGQVDVTGGSVVSEWGYFTIPTIANYNTSGGHNYTYNTPTGMIVEGGTHFDLIAEALASNGTLGDKFTMYRINNGVVIGVTDNFTVADYNSQIAGTHLLYPLATPIEITTTPENLTAISGENNVYGDTNGDTEVEYYIEV